MFSAFWNYIKISIYFPFRIVLFCRYIIPFARYFVNLFYVRVPNEQKVKKKTIYVNIYYVSQRLIFCLLAFRSYFFRFFFARLNHNRDKHLWWTNFNLTLSIFYWFLFYFIFVDRHRFVFLALLLFLGQCFTLFYCKIPHFITSHSIFM